MIDVVFLLLVFFIVTYKITEQEKDKRISVPTSSEGVQSNRIANEIVINITKDGEISISGESYTKESLRKKLSIIVEASRLSGEKADGQPVRLRTDAETSSQQLFSVMDEVFKAGISDIRFASRQAAPSP